MSALMGVMGVAPCVVILVFSFAVGAIMGSFICCVAYRTVVGESPWKGRSHCDSCGHVLGVLDLIPIVSWLAAGGKCRYCKAPISPTCLIAEVVLGVAFALLAWFFGLGLPTLAYWAFATVLLGLSLVDLETMTIPNGFVIAGIVVWVLFAACCAACSFAGVDVSVMGHPAVVQTCGLLGAVLPTWAAPVADALLGGVVMFVGMLLFCLAFEKVSGKVGLGGGDLKLLFVCGLFLGLPLSFFNLILSCVLGLVFFAVGAGKSNAPADGSEKASATPFPFGPAIAAASVLTLLVGPGFLSWYVGLLF